MLTALFTTISISLGLPTGLLSSLCYVESKYKVNAIHHDDGGANSVGICQVKLATAKDYGFRGTEKELMKPETNIRIAGLYLKHQINRYNSVQRGVIAYNQGHAAVRTTRYQRKVFKEWSHVRARR
jgi:soluble lytic murein transglycosylase-like protein